LLRYYLFWPHRGQNLIDGGSWVPHLEHLSSAMGFPQFGQKALEAGTAELQLGQFPWSDRSWVPQLMHRLEFESLSVPHFGHGL
jgi:hypothetical protein